MKLSKKYIQQFNKPETVLVLSTYPRKGHTYDPKALAVAPFTKNKVNAIAKKATQKGKPVKFVILADMIEGEDAYLENSHLILRCWTRNLITVYATIQKIINLFPNAKTLVIEHEFGIFGLKHQISAQFPIFLLFNRLSGKRILLILHQVIFDLGQLSGHLQIDPGSPLTKLLNAFIRLNYVLFGLIANHVVVFDQNLKEKLCYLVNPSKISAIPLPNSGKKSPSKNKSSLRHDLGLEKDTFYLLFAGYVTWYKGADWLVNAFSQIKKQIKNKKVKLLIAGGQSSSLEIDTKYMNWFNKLSRKIEKNNDIVMTGVLPEKELPKYIAAADLMIMPYRLMMSASGPFTLAQSTGTPTIISKHLEPMTRSEDFSVALHKSKLTSSDIVFDYSSKGLLLLIDRAIKQKGYLNRLGLLVNLIRPNRSCQFQAQEYFNLIQPKQNAKLDLWPKTLRSSDIAFR